MIKWRRSTTLPAHIMFEDDSPVTHVVSVTGPDGRTTIHYRGTLAQCERELAKRNQTNASMYLTREILPI